jgi:hypothetical protein
VGNSRREGAQVKACGGVVRRASVCCGSDPIRRSPRACAPELGLEPFHQESRIVLSASPTPPSSRHGLTRSRSRPDFAAAGQLRQPGPSETPGAARPAGVGAPGPLRDSPPITRTGESCRGVGKRRRRIEHGRAAAPGPHVVSSGCGRVCFCPKAPGRLRLRLRSCRSLALIRPRHRNRKPGR